MANCFAKKDETMTRKLIASGAMDTLIYMVKTRDAKMTDKGLDGLQ